MAYTACERCQRVIQIIYQVEEPSKVEEMAEADTKEVDLRENEYAKFGPDRTDLLRLLL